MYDEICSSKLEEISVVGIHLEVTRWHNEMVESLENRRGTLFIFKTRTSKAIEITKKKNWSVCPMTKFVAPYSRFICPSDVALFRFLSS